MEKLSIEQRRRVNNFVPGFYRYIREGTLNHCRRLWQAGMESEALEIGFEFKIKKEEICR
jgi:hypothetical protein